MSSPSESITNQTASPEPCDSPVPSLANEDDVPETSQVDGEEGDSTTTEPGSNKRKEVMTLPLPPGALPPRKRAKTKDEKEQRRIERIMRNRQAAHASREKKRRHVEDLEKKCVSLSTENEQLQSQMVQLKNSYSEVSDHSSFLRAKISELVNAIETAKQSGDMSSIETSKILQDVDSKLTSTISPISALESFAPSLVADNDSDSHSENGSISAPSLSSSAAASPSTSALDITTKQEEDNSVVISLPEEYPVFGMVDFRAHHPAEVMGKDQQRRPSNQPRSLPTLSSSTT